MSKKHPGFKAVAKKIQGEGYSKKAAGAILASATRHASPAAKKKNPRLKKVSMPKRGGRMANHKAHAPHHTPSTHPHHPGYHS